MREEGIQIVRYRFRELMEALGLDGRCRVAITVTIQSKFSDAVADNRLSPIMPQQAWASGVAYLKTVEGWLYLAVIMGFSSSDIGLAHQYANCCRFSESSAVVERFFLEFKILKVA